MGISPLQYLLMQERLRVQRKVPPNAPKDDDAREVGHGGLHDQIMAWCDAQWPRWRYIHSRTDKRSTVQVGSQDFTIFCPEARVLCVECKRPSGKRTPAQTAWAMEMARLGHAVYLVTTMQEFLALTIQTRIPSPSNEPSQSPTHSRDP